MRSCECIALVGDYINDDLSDESRRAVDAHLNEDCVCGSYLAAYRSTIALACDAYRDDADDAELESFIRRVLAHHADAEGHRTH